MTNAVGPVAAPTGRRLPRRLVQLYAGLVLYGFSMAVLVMADIGVMPWDVLHQGIARRVGGTLGTVTIVTGAVVLLAWVPLRQRPGIGTISNVVVIGIAVDASLAVLPDLGDVDGAADVARRVALVAVGIVLNAVATAAYIGVDLGPGPRDGLMTGLVRRTGGSVRVVRTGIEVAVVTAGALLGGTLGPATALYALTIGPLVQPLLPRLTVARGAVSRHDAAPALPDVPSARPALTTVNLTTVNLSAADPHALARFYAALLGWSVSVEEPDWVLVRDPAGGVGLSCQREDPYVAPVWPAVEGAPQMQVHLDLRVDDLDEGVRHAVACGATVADAQPQADVRVCLDPQGHPFCLWVETEIET